MAEKLLSIHVRGKQSLWSFEFRGDPKYIPEWRADGLDVYEVENIIPFWLPPILVRPFVIAQDLFNFKSPWRKP